MNKFTDTIQKKRDKLEKESITELEDPENLSRTLLVIANFLESIAAGEESENTILAAEQMIQSAVHCQFNDRHTPVNMLINIAIQREAERLALDEYPIEEGELPDDNYQ